MKPSEWFVIRNTQYYVYSGKSVSDEDAETYKRILALLKAVENTQIWEVRPTSTNTNPLPWLEEHALPGKGESNKQKILWAALALNEATTAKSAAGGHKRASRGDK